MFLFDTKLLVLILYSLSSIAVTAFEEEVIILDTNGASSWEINENCIYVDMQEDEGFENCPARVIEDESRGYWSVCDRTGRTCRFSYVVQDKIPYKIKIRVYVVPASETTMDLELRYSSGSEPTYEWYKLPSSAAWETYETTFDQQMAPGSKIDISSWGKYEDGQDFLMVDRVELFIRPVVITTTAQPQTTTTAQPETTTAQPQTTTSPGNPSELILDTVDELNGWAPGSCVYANDYLDHHFEPCRVDITGDDEGNAGYWSFCNNPHDCRLRYEVIPEIIPTRIHIRAYMTPSLDGQTPIITLIYRNPEGSNQFQEFGSEEGGWRSIDYEFGVDLLPGATIEVKQTGIYENGRDFSMIDKIILRG